MEMVINLDGICSLDFPVPLVPMQFQVNLETAPLMEFVGAENLCGALKRKDGDMSFPVFDESVRKGLCKIKELLELLWIRSEEEVAVMGVCCTHQGV